MHLIYRVALINFQHTQKLQWLQDIVELGGGKFIPRTSQKSVDLTDSLRHFLYARNPVMVVNEIKSSSLAPSAFSHLANELSRSCLFRRRVQYVERARR